MSPHQTQTQTRGPEGGIPQQALNAERPDKNRRALFANWTAAAVPLLSKEIFDRIQFANIMSITRFGSRLQTIICDCLVIKTKHQAGWWAASGREKTVKVLRQRRQAVSKAMKTKFLCKFILLF